MDFWCFLAIFELMSDSNMINHARLAKSEINEKENNIHGPACGVKMVEAEDSDEAVETFDVLFVG